MEELTAIKTAEGREFKPWVTKDDLQAAVQDPASITAIASEIASGKQAIADAINAQGGSASATDSFNELAEAVEEIPNFSDMVKLAGIIAGGNYNKDALQGHNENVKYGKTEIIDNVGAFEKINVPYCFQNWDLLKRVDLPSLVNISGSRMFNKCSNLEQIILSTITGIGNHIFYNVGGKLINVVFGTLVEFGTDNYFSLMPLLRNITIGQDTDVNLPFQNWTATNVIAEGQSGIAELNSNLYNNLLTKLYDHSQDGVTRTLRLGWLANVTAENIAYANAKGWTLTT